MKTIKAAKDCLDWLKYCLEIGWNKSDIDRLEQLWWLYHTDEGELQLKK